LIPLYDRGPIAVSSRQGMVLPLRLPVPIAIVFALWLVAAAAAAPAPKIAPDASSFSLENGLVVVVIPDHRAPVVTHMVWYKAGAAEDPPGKSGIAHFLEHLMFKGTTNHPPGELRTRIAEIGGNDNAFTTHDYTAYHQTVAREHLGLMMEFEADRMANLVIDDAAIAIEREVIIEERRSRVDNEPGAELSEAINAALFQNGRYGIPIIGWAHEMATLDRADALAFYERHYTPNNAVLVVAGDVNEAEVRRLAEATYGRLPRRAEPPPRIRASEPTPIAARTVTLSDPRVTLPAVRRLYLAPSYGNAAPGEAEALDVLGEILGGGTTSRFYRRLVVDKPVAASAGAGYGGNAIDDGSFSLYAVPRDRTSLEALSAEFDAIVAELLEKGVTDDELVRAKRRMIADSIYVGDSQSALARMFGQALATGGSLADVRDWPQRIEAVSAGEVLTAARKYLDIRRSVTGYLTGAPGNGRT
jgi:zinc protease